MPPLPTIDCKECGHVNEGERVYCHNCGAKLDRSVLIGRTESKESLEEKQRRIKKMMNPDSGLGRGWWKTGLQTLLAAAMTAAIFDLVLPPEGVPPMPKRGEPEDILQLDIALENLVVSRPGTRIVIKQDEVNSYLKNKVHLKYDGNVFQTATAFQRAFVNFSRAGCRITMQNTILDYPIYLSQQAVLKIDTVPGEQGEMHRALVAMPMGSRIGRLALPAIVSGYEGFIFDPLWEALRRERRMLDQLREIEISNGEAFLTSNGPTAPRSGTAPTSERPAASPNSPKLGNSGALQIGGLQSGGLQPHR